MKVSKYIVKELCSDHYGYNASYTTRAKLESVSECAHFIEKDLESRTNVGDKFYIVTLAEFDTEAFEMECTNLFSFDFGKLDTIARDIKEYKFTLERLKEELKLKRSPKVIAEWNNKIIKQNERIEAFYNEYGTTRNLLERDMKKAKGMH